MADMEDMLTCPYNRSHVVSKLRMAQHLVKCQANYPHVVLATCYYDFLHRVPPEELNEHLETCPSKHKFPTQFCINKKPTGESGDPTKNIFLKNSSSEKRKGSTVSLHSIVSTGDHSKGAIPKSSKATDPKRHESTKASSSKPQMVSKGKGIKHSKPKEESWDTDSSD